MTLSKDILDKIKKGEVRMHSKMYFILKTLLFVISFIITIFIAVFLISSIFFALRITSATTLPKLGYMGIGKFLIFFPWVITLISIFLILIIEKQAKKIKTVYRKPLVFSLTIVLLFITFFSFLVAKTPLHNKIYQHRYPFMEQMYKMQLPKDVIVGTIIEFNKNNFQIKTKEGNLLLISTSTQTRFPKYQNLHINDMIMIIGKTNNQIIEAKAIRIMRKPLIR